MQEFGNIISYLKSEQRTFTEAPFCPVDSLIFSTLSYFNFETIDFVDLVSPKRVDLQDILALSDWSALVSHSWLANADQTQDFLDALMSSRRMRKVQIAFYINEMAKEVEKQFSATTFFFPFMTEEDALKYSLDECKEALLSIGYEQNGSEFPREAAYLSFRGTDGSLAGWKEDFNLCFKEVIPSQQSAVAYVSGVASACRCPLILGGHSKGGNIAEYAALTIESEAYDRIIGVFNHDGPSFLDDPSPRIDDESFTKMFHKTVPESSLFGMILERRDDYKIVQSSAFALMQHEPFSWIVKGRDFLYEENLGSGAEFFDSALDDWLRSKTPKERERFIDTLYELFVSTEAHSWSEFQNNFMRNMATVFGAASKVDPETRAFIMQTFGVLAKILKDKTVQKFWFSNRNDDYDYPPSQYSYFR